MTWVQVGMSRPREERSVEMRMREVLERKEARFDVRWDWMRAELREVIVVGLRVLMVVWDGSVDW